MWSCGPDGHLTVDVWDWTRSSPTETVRWVDCMAG